MHEEASVGEMWVAIEVIDTGGVETGGTAFESVDFVPFFEEEFCEV